MFIVILNTISSHADRYRRWGAVNGLGLDWHNILSQKRCEWVEGAV
jgi:hypothetical protein